MVFVEIKRKIKVKGGNSWRHLAAKIRRTYEKEKAIRYFLFVRYICLNLVEYFSQINAYIN